MGVYVSGCAAVLLVVMGVLGVGLLCVWKRRHTATAAHGHVNNTVDESEWHIVVVLIPLKECLFYR